MSSPICYRVYITPLITRTTFGAEVEVTNDCDLSQSIIKAGVDKEPFDIGSFLYDDMKIVMSNQYGTYSSQEDSRAMFKYLRDGSKVRIVYHDSDDVETDMFKGLIDEIGTFDDITLDQVTLSILSKDSVIRRLQVNAGSINNGTSFFNAIASLLDRSEITTFLSFSTANMSLGLNLTIDNGAAFDSMTTRDALDQLLAASNSVMLVNIATDSISIRPRTLNVVSSHPLYGPDAYSGAQNIVDVRSYVSGYGHMFNCVSVNGTVYIDTQFPSKYLAKTKEFTFDFMTDNAKELLIGAAIAGEFKAPKPEIKVEVSTSLAKSYGFFDPFTLDLPPRRTPAPGQTHVPLYGQAVYGTDKYPISTGSFRVSDNIIFKLIGIEVSLANFTTILRLVRTY